MVSGIEMPQQSIVALRLQVDQSLARLSGDANVVIFGCDHAAQLDALAGSDTAVFSLLCIGMLPPAFIEYALRGGADGVLVTGCRSDDCAFRLGNHLIKARIEGAREPHLRQNIPRDRVRIVWGAQGDFQQLKNELGRFRSTLISLARDRRRGRTKV